jgi:hypothetical protein
MLVLSPAGLRVAKPYPGELHGRWANLRGEAAAVVVRGGNNALLRRVVNPLRPP